MCPNVFIDQGDTYWCSFHLTDIEPDDHACEEGQRSTGSVQVVLSPLKNSHKYRDAES